GTHGGRPRERGGALHAERIPLRAHGIRRRADDRLCVPRFRLVDGRCEGLLAVPRGPDPTGRGGRAVELHPLLVRPRAAGPWNGPAAIRCSAPYCVLLSGDALWHDRRLSGL